VKFLKQHVTQAMIMRKIQHFLLTFIFTTLCFQNGFAAPTSPQKSHKTPFLIGAIYNLSGEQAPIDVPSAKGAKMAVHMINEEGGLQGHPLKLILKDGHSDPETVVDIAKQFVKDPNIKVVIGLNGTDMVQRVAPIFLKGKKIFISTGATSSQLVLLSPKYLFLICFTDDVQASSAAEYIYQFLQLKSGAVLYDGDTDYTKSLKEFFSKRYLEQNGTIVSSQSFQHTDHALTEQIANLKKDSKSIQFIYLAANPASAPLIIRALRNANLEMPIIGSDSFIATNILKTVGPTANNISFTTHAVVNPEFVNYLPALMRQYIATQKFFYEYQKFYGKNPSSVFSALSYDAINFVVTALSDIKHYDTNRILFALNHLSTFVGVTGSISYVQGQTAPKKTVSIVDIKDGKAFFLGNWIPAVLASDS